SATRESRFHHLLQVLAWRSSAISRSRFCHRQNNGDACTLMHRISGTFTGVLNFYTALVLIYDFFNDGQPQAGPMFLRRCVGFDYARHDFLGEAVTVIPDT